MIKILLCCGGGFSSSFVAERMKKEIQNLGMEDDVMIEFSPFSIAKNRFLEFDIVDIRRLPALGNEDEKRSLPKHTLHL